ncbi:hypothetical protein FXO38_05550 [Capsicum annuum]|nr:hypothetical protein FXO37_32615 [Capsicum annuum]KAF3673675.1 hypothetical protein FXO38_05550 [Capsicum annuum]
MTTPFGNSLPSHGRYCAYLLESYGEAVEFTYLNNLHHPGGLATTPISIRWKPPLIDFYKLNTDGYSFGNPGIGGIGRVIRNNNGNWVLGFCKGFPVASNNQMELISLLEGLNLLEQHHPYPLEIKTLKRSVLRRIERPVVMHCCRKQNSVVDALAKEGPIGKAFGSMKIFAVPPVYVMKYFRKYLH